MASKLQKLQLKYTFDDLLISPNASHIEPKKVKINSRLTKNIKLKVPIISSPMDTVTEAKMAIALAKLGCIGAIHRNMSIHQEVEQVKKVKSIQPTEKNATTDENKNLRVAAAIGPFDLERAKALDAANVDAIIIDCAHGHNLNVIKSARKIKKEISCDLIVGNIATPEAVEDYLSVEPDAFRVGLGSGSICTTRIVTGIGVPQASAIHEVYLKANEYDIPIIADGGIRHGGDIVKALALGADSVMLGNLLAGCEESPGKVIDGSLFGLKGNYKLYRGMGSKSVINNIDRYMKSSKHAPEGIETLVAFKGSVKDVIEELAWSIKQGMGYVGASDIKQLREKASFVLVTPHTVVKNYLPTTIQIDAGMWKKLIEVYSSC
jgi:IMP dehydrogenase